MIEVRMNIKEKINSIEKKIAIPLIYFFLFISILFPIIEKFKFISADLKSDIQIIFLLSSIALMVNFLRNLDINIQNKDMNKLTPYNSTTTNMSEVENKLESYNKCDLYVLGNTLSTMWNSLLKHYFTRIKNKEIKTQLKVRLIKKIEPEFYDNPEKDPVISSIIEWFNEHKTSIKLEIYITRYPLFFTGICMNKDFLKYRFLNKDTNKEILGSAYKGTDEIADRVIEWFICAFEDICKGQTPIYKYPIK